ncbi:hypothetical protein D3875_14370 [Deinococcus cavernae]|uniref:CvpA family protein n=1 Tax=Deinococcus cavernae TaxID=2320857 RepID=A0A418V8Y3_9DEIO|nr:hypothetical protein [Deinococcus cavernae]RJF72550.1 hypothetical protein D3875_14370 [Deinococcus cavernae]
MTWFDALLITLLALVTALGARRGLAGLAWGVGALVVAFVTNVLGLGGVPSAVLALLLGAVSGLAISRLIPDPLERPSHMLAGGVGGLLLGTVMIASLALAFPMAVRATPSGKQSLYPSPDLAPGLYSAVANSAIQTGLRSIWTSSVAARTLLLPDRAR